VIQYGGALETRSYMFFCIFASMCCQAYCIFLQGSDHSKNYLGALLLSTSTGTVQVRSTTGRYIAAAKVFEGGQTTHIDVTQMKA